MMHFTLSFFALLVLLVIENIFVTTATCPDNETKNNGGLRGATMGYNDVTYGLVDIELLKRSVRTGYDDPSVYDDDNSDENDEEEDEDNNIIDTECLMSFHENSNECYFSSRQVFESDVHHGAIIADGRCNYDPDLGFYKAECDDGTDHTDDDDVDQESTSFFLRKVFCSDDTCQDCATPEDVSLLSGNDSPSGPVFLSQENIHAVCEIASDFGVYLEVTGNCLAMDICRETSSSSRISY